MPSAKQFAGYLVVGAVLSVSSFSIANATSVVVNNEKLTVQTPTLSPGTGITYVANGNAGTLTVNTAGFLFCANFQPQTANEVTLVPTHESSGATPAHPWDMPSVKDIHAFGYGGGGLSINRNSSGVIASGLACHGVGAQGDVVSGLSEAIFLDAFEAANPTATNYHNLVNWKSPPGFDWTSSSQWALVPTDPCRPSANDPAQAEEDVACAAVTGVRGTATRAPIMWTWSNGSYFTYLFRVDARFGSQLPSLGGNTTPPQILGAGEASAGAQMYVSVRDAYDKAYLSPAARSCMFPLADLPQTLDGNTCPMAGGQNFNGPLNYPFYLPTPPQFAMDTSFYVAVTRKVVGAPVNSTTPVVGAAIFVEPAAEGGDRFTGDDVVFGFMDGSAGFSWMSGQ